MTEAAGSVTMAKASLDGADVVLYRSQVDGTLVVDVSTVGREGPIRVYLNDGAVWHGDPEFHLHDDCDCVEAWGERGHG